MVCHKKRNEENKNAFFAFLATEVQGITWKYFLLFSLRKVAIHFNNAGKVAN